MSDKDLVTQSLARFHHETLPIPASGVYPSVIVEVTPDELGRVRAGELKLPNGWQIAAAALPKC